MSSPAPLVHPSVHPATKPGDTKPSIPAPRGRSGLSPHLQRLEDEAIHILREVVAEFRRPVMLYSVGKDSSVMLHLARKAFFPAPPPFPFLHIASAATDVDGVIAELLDARSSERQGRLVDGALQASMERKKKEGYF